MRTIGDEDFKINRGNSFITKEISTKNDEEAYNNNSFLEGMN